MKKTFLMAASLLLLAACKPDGQEETLVQSIEVTPGTVICTDLTEEDGKWITDHIEQSGNMGNYPAMQYCRSLGEHWYLPTCVELAELEANAAAIDAALTANGHGSLPVPLSLLSCIKVDDYMVYRVMDGSTSTTTKGGFYQFHFLFLA